MTQFKEFFSVTLFASFNALTLSVGQQEGHRACKNFAPKPLSHGMWY